MKDSDTTLRSTKKAYSKGAATNGNGISNTKITKFFSSFYSSSKTNETTTTTATSRTSNNGTPQKKKEKSDKRGEQEVVRKRGRPRKHDVAITKTITNGGKLKKRSSIASQDPSSVSSDSSASSTSSATTTVVATTNGESTPKKRGRKSKLMSAKKKGNNKSSPKLRPRRRASQTYFFKYQLARNPLKAEEEDLKQALIASLQHCGDEQVKAQSTEQQDHVENNHNHNNKQPKKENHSNLQQPSKQQKTKHPPPKQPTHQETVILQEPTPPAYDEEYLKRYRPETEDFLTFICFRVTAPNFPSQKQIELSGPTASGSLDHLTHVDNNNINDGPLNGCTTSTGINVRISNDRTSNDYHNLRRSTSPCKSSASNHTASNSSPNHLYSPSNRRRPTRQSPRLASSSRKISEIDSLNNYTAYDNQITYEEDIKKAQIALEDMAHEINGSEINEPGAQSGHRQNNHQQQPSPKTSAENGCVPPSGKSLSPFKNNKHLVKGLMTREFAGAFADEEIIFESIKNNKL